MLVITENVIKFILNMKFSKMALKDIGKNILGVMGVSLAIGISICGTIYGILSITEKNYSYEIFESKAELSYYATKDDLVKCIDNYIHSVAENSAMNGIAIIDVCDKYNLDIRFVIAQAQVEGHFATKGIAYKTHSAFNVCAYDGRTANDMINKGHIFKHPDLSIEPYAKLLAENYLVNGKTEMDMLDNFVNKDGKRYASNANYEKMLRGAYQKFTDETNVNALYAEYQKYKMICNK